MRRKLVPLIAGLLLLLGANASLALTLSEVRTAIRRNVRDTASSSSLRRYSDTVLNAFINEAQRSVINDTWAVSDIDSQSVTSGTSYYTLASTVIKPWRVTLDGVPLPELSVIQIDADNGGSAWETTSGTPTAYFFNRGNSTQIGLTPIPNASGTLKIYSYSRVADLSSDSDVPFDSEVRLYVYHDLLVYHVSYRLLVEENRIPEAEQYKDVYNGGVEIMNANVGHKPARALAPSKEIKP